MAVKSPAKDGRSNKCPEVLQKQNSHTGSVYITYSIAIFSFLAIGPTPFSLCRNIKPYVDNRQPNTLPFPSVANTVVKTQLKYQCMVDLHLHQKDDDRENT